MGAYLGYSLANNSLSEKLYTMVFRYTCNADIAQAMFFKSLTGHELHVDKHVSNPEHILTLATSLPKQSIVLTNTDNKVQVVYKDIKQTPISHPELNHKLRMTSVSNIPHEIKFRSTCASI